jgi:hypothetical protein
VLNAEVKAEGVKVEAGIQLHPSALDFSIYFSNQHSAFSTPNVEL